MHVFQEVPYHVSAPHWSINLLGLETTTIKLYALLAVAVALPIPKGKMVYIIKPFDLILSADDSYWVGKVVSDVQSATDGREGNLWAHVGVIVDSSVLPLKELKPGELYVYHSSIAIDPVDKRFKKPAKDGEYSGPLIHQLDDYLRYSNIYNVIAIAPLVKSLRNELKRKKNIPQIMSKFHQEKAADVFHDYNAFGHIIIILTRTMSVMRKVVKYFAPMSVMRKVVKYFAPNLLRSCWLSELIFKPANEPHPKEN